jgi:hypothetical protein
VKKGSRKRGLPLVGEKKGGSRKRRLLLAGSARIQKHEKGVTTSK